MSIERIIKNRYKDRQKQAAYENAYDCLYYGYGKSYWNSCGLDKQSQNEVWKQAFQDICREG